LNIYFAKARANTHNLLLEETYVSLKVPKVSSAQSAGIDFSAPYDFSLLPGKSISIATGFHVVIPKGFAGLIYPRSGISIKYGIINLAGLIDSDYRGEIIITLARPGTLESDVYSAGVVWKVHKGERFAQMAIVGAPVKFLNEIPLDELLGNNKTDRGEGGHGSTGLE
jgi:dUTP pyrophosphatase